MLQRRDESRKRKAGVGEGHGVDARTHARHHENRSSRFKRTPAEGWWVYLRVSNRIIPTNMLTQTVSCIRSWCISMYLQLFDQCYYCSIQRIQTAWCCWVVGDLFYPILETKVTDIVLIAAQSNLCTVGSSSSSLGFLSSVLPMLQSSKVFFPSR